jgi:ankyrin repeat protein
VSWGKTPLWCAAAGNHLGVVVQLLGMGADVQRQNEGGELSMYRAAAEGHAEVQSYK